MRYVVALVAFSCSDSALGPEKERRPAGDFASQAGGDAERNDPGDSTPPGAHDDDVQPPVNVVRFVALGDGGEGNAEQFQVGAAVQEVCRVRGCDFAIYLGDNFYDNGVDAVDDEQFQSKFEQPYAALDLPFYVVLGNHDYGSSSLEQWRSAYQVSYTNVSAKWTMPDEFYTFSAAHTQFFGLDTNAIMLDWTADAQAAWLDAQLASSTAAWRIAFGHHPYISNGHHGNAGNYEGCSPFCPVVDGENVKDFMEGHVCGQIDVYFCGHDHNRQWLSPVCGTEFIVSGAAAKTTPFDHRDDQPTRWEDDQIEGFMWVEISGDTFHGVFYDATGALQYERTFTR